MGEPIERQHRVYQMKTSINQRLIETGERDRLKELLRTRLIECGWKDQLKAYCKEIIREKGVENVSVDDLIAAVTPRGRVNFSFLHSDLEQCTVPSPCSAPEDYLGRGGQSAEHFVGWDALG
ncbi:hypothetical protein HPB50_016145 [Hyalomma asiaticum]|uniref:Uncharacterized protein n=1 Tax=Hyalomma asiaticum TaxID=266040 RepID=A0ACB7TJE5_HYAAI|nr:hypothetical protein HPB50_016145 [Hyalomma asiaticum]